ncbi:MAG: hypothetical protein ABI594_19235 [Ginsengibacter sp.]
MKKNSKILVALLLISTIASVAILAQKGTGDEAISQGQVMEAVQTFAKLVNDQNAQSFGLQNADQLKSLKAGNQVKKYMIGLDDVKKYTPGQDVQTIMKELPVVEVALTDANGGVITSIEFTKQKDNWQATGFGSSPEIKSLFSDRAMVADSLISGGKLVVIPALHSNFLAVNNGGGLNFLVLEQNDNLGFRQGAMIPASEAMTKLLTAANEYNGLPQ